MSNSLETRWLQHEPSTYSYLGRNDAAVSWLLQQKLRSGHTSSRTIVILGSGMIEPFTIAALPEAQNSHVIAVELEKDLVALGNELKSGRRASWSEVAAVSKHPGTQNSQLLDVRRIQKGLNTLGKLGSLDSFGGIVTTEAFQVPQDLADRVTFMNSDSLSAIKTLSDLDLICDFFVQTNINKSGEEGVNYTRTLVEEAVERLSTQGVYLIGDTGYNHRHTLSHIAGLAEARINAGSLVHIINKGSNFSSSWYLAVSKGELLGSDEIGGIRTRVDALAKTHDLEVQEVRLTNHELALRIDQNLYLAYLADAEGLITWSSVDPLPQALLHLAQKPEDEFGETIIFPGKKNHS